MHRPRIRCLQQSTQSLIQADGDEEARSIVRHLAVRCGDEAAHQDEGEGIQREAKLPHACGIQEVRRNRQACEMAAL